MKNKDGWEIKKLGDIAKASYGYTEKASLEEIGPKFLRITDIQEDGVNWDTVPYCKIIDADLDKFKLQNDDIVFARTGATTGKSYLIKNPPISVFASYLIKVKITTEELSANFVFKYFQSNTYWRKINAGISGSTQGGFNASKLSDLVIPIPPLPTQHQIVSELDTLSDIISKKKQQIEELDKLAQATFYDMFGDPVTNEKGWEIKVLSEVCSKIMGGGTPSKSQKEYYNGNIPWVTPKDMKIDFINTSKILITQLGVDNSSANIVPKGAILMVIRSGILKHTLPLAIATCPLTINQDMKAFICNDNVLNLYLFKCLKAFEKNLLDNVRGVTADNIEFNIIRILKIPTPPILLQTQFASKIESIETQKELINQSIGDVQQLFDYTMDKYFNS